jgi:hypothetical protein
LITLGLCQPAQAQSAVTAFVVTVSDIRVDYSFGEGITFTARIQSASVIQEALISFQAQGDPNTRIAPIQIGADGMTSYQYPISAGLLRPFTPALRGFTRIFFWYRLTLQSGEVYTSPQFYFDYVDNRFPWQILEDATLRLHWYAGDITFGQAAFDVARIGRLAVSSLIPTTASEPIDIYIYATPTDVQNALSLGGQPPGLSARTGWLAGQDCPDLGVVLVSISPGAEQTTAMQRQIPHELAHVLLYRLTGPAYNQLPTWLREGIASLVELYPNADYVQVLGIASQTQTLLPIPDLCGPFPQDALWALMAYAESASFTRYLHDTYGTSGLLTLIQAYTDGLDCEQGAARAFGSSLSQIDQQWRQAALGENVGGIAFRNLLPYLFVLAVILAFPAWGFRSARKRKTSHDASQSR